MLLKRKNRILLPILLFVFCQSMANKTDSSDVLTLQNYLSIVREYNPIAKQANLLIDNAKAELLFAKGNFDPMLSSDYVRKEFSDKNYYSYFTVQGKIPLWIGEVKIGYDYNYGININNENILPKEGLGYVGISIPLLQNLITDKKRTQLRKVKSFMLQSAANQKNELNNLYYDAVLTYFYWIETYQKLTIIKQSLQNAKTRFNNTKALVINGDKAAIDTLDVFTIVQQRENDFIQAQYELAKAKINVSIFVWDEFEKPVFLADGVIPDTTLLNLPPNIAEKTLHDLMITLQQNHPQLIATKEKIKQLMFDKKLKAETLRPNLSVNANWLTSKNYNFTNPLSQNYKIGFSFSMPLTFTQPRADYKIAKIKLRDAELDLIIKNNQLNAKLQTYYLETINYVNQFENMDKLSQNYKTLLDAEYTKFNIGESSTFLLNSREIKWLESCLKLIETKTKTLKSYYTLKWIVADL